MSNVYSEMRALLEEARVAGECAYAVYSGMFDCVDEAEEERDRLESWNARALELISELHGAYIDMIDQYRTSETDCIWESCGAVSYQLGELDKECEKARHRFDSKMSELGIKAGDSA